MSPHSTLGWFRRHAAPLVVLLIMVIAVIVVPPLVLGEVTERTYALTAAVVLLAVSAAFPYAVLVAVGSLPLLYTGAASFAAPKTGADTAHEFSTVAALRHVAAGISYVVGATVVGAIGIGAQFAVGSETTAIPAVFQPVVQYLGGVIVAVAFVSLQLWRYDTPLRALARRTIIGTVVLGVLLALSPTVAFWVFNGTI